VTIKETLEQVEGVIWHEIEETVVEGMRLGRHFHFDPREDASKIPLAPKVVSVMHKTNGLPLDQGALGSCTANALVGALNSSPDFTSTATVERLCQSVHVGAAPRTEADAIHLYSVETIMEGQPYPPNDPGGSGIMVSRAAKSLGWIKDYAHTYNAQHSLMALTLRPGILGIPWYDSFDSPSNGLIAISPNAGVRGGHEILAAGLSIPERLVWFVNSWGTSYGVANSALGVSGGAFCMSFDTFEALLDSSNGGDYTVPLV
jgi:hypothetical protein